MTAAPHVLKKLRERIAGVQETLEKSLQPDFELISFTEFKNRFRLDLNFLRFLYTRGSSLYSWTFQEIFLSRVEARSAEENLIYEDEYEYEFRRTPVSGGIREVHCLNAILDNTGFAVENFCEAFLPKTAPEPDPQKAVLLKKIWKGNLSGFTSFSPKQAHSDALLAHAKGLTPPSSPYEIWSSKGMYGGWKLRRLFLTPQDVYRSIFDGLAGWSPYLNPQRLDEDSYIKGRQVVSFFIEEFPTKAYATRFCYELIVDSMSAEHLHVLEESAYWSSILRIWELYGHWSEPSIACWETALNVFPPSLHQYKAFVALLTPFTAADTAQLVASFLVDPFFPSWRRCWAFSEEGLRCTSPLPFPVEEDFFCELHDEVGKDWMHRGDS